ncbi:endonuclease/exonuclease/phosphatase family protein [Tenacibaculum agarivorans]|uniref:endonuclease/exonuclease/phosphatase family protein n=1 Tax=Tenacibaculum agarivorans TaxID=1908389 RepID=UPI00094B89D4|nr:endonuclease/exonuclease/phosphatase family protein [Tenacibaculum agarivorans]
MRKFLQLIFKVILFLFLLLTVFYFWGSSPSLTEESYTTLSKHEFNVETKNDSVFSIVTYNIGYLSGMTNNTSQEKPKVLFEDNLDKVTTAFKRLNPDIIAFQEIDYNSSRSYKVDQEKEIAKLGYNYVARAVNWDKKYIPFPYWPFSSHFGKVVSGQSIVSKFPIKDHKRIVLDSVKNTPFYRKAFYLDRLLQVAKVMIEGKELMVLNVHLEAFDKQIRVQQLKKVVELLRMYTETNPTILLGDFNSDPLFKDAAISQILKMQNIGCTAFSKENLKNTYDSKNPHIRLDYIFYTEENIEYISGDVLNEFGQASDHLPVEMKFKFK